MSCSTERGPPGQETSWRFCCNAIHTSPYDLSITILLAFIRTEPSTSGFNSRVSIAACPRAKWFADTRPAAVLHRVNPNGPHVSCVAVCYGLTSLGRGCVMSMAKAETKEQKIFRISTGRGLALPAPLMSILIPRILTDRRARLQLMEFSEHMSSAPLIPVWRSSLENVPCARSGPSPL